MQYQKEADTWSDFLSNSVLALTIEDDEQSIHTKTKSPVSPVLSNIGSNMKLDEWRPLGQRSRSADPVYDPDGHNEPVVNNNWTPHSNLSEVDLVHEQRLRSFSMSYDKETSRSWEWKSKDQLQSKELNVNLHSEESEQPYITSAPNSISKFQHQNSSRPRSAENSINRERGMSEDIGRATNLTNSHESVSNNQADNDDVEIRPKGFLSPITTKPEHHLASTVSFSTHNDTISEWKTQIDDSSSIPPHSSSYQPHVPRSPPNYTNNVSKQTPVRNLSMSQNNGMDKTQEELCYVQQTNGNPGWYGVPSSAVPYYNYSPYPHQQMMPHVGLSQPHEDPYYNVKPMEPMNRMPCVGEYAPYPMMDISNNNPNSNYYHMSNNLGYPCNPPYPDRNSHMTNRCMNWNDSSQQGSQSSPIEPCIQDPRAHHHLPSNLAGASYGSNEWVGPKAYYEVEFKRGRRELFYGKTEFKVGNKVKVEADRGEDLGCVIRVSEDFQSLQNDISEDTSSKHPEHLLKRIVRLAAPEELGLVEQKLREEQEVLEVCRSKAQQRLLPMKVIDAEYQFDRHKLTFFFEADRRIDFRELVRDLFAVYKTRIWLQQVVFPIGKSLISDPSNDQ